MSICSVRLAIAVVTSVIPSFAWAQHEAHQAGIPQAVSPELVQCLRVQPAIEKIITAATARAEAARLSNPVEYSAEVIADGRAHFADHCATCHANDGSAKTAHKH